MAEKKPVYFVSNLLTDTETRDSNFKKITLALRMVSKKLRLFFPAHTIIVLTSYIIRAILHKPDAFGIILKRVKEPSKLNMVYRPRFAINGQVLAKFIVEMSDMHTDDISELL